MSYPWLVLELLLIVFLCYQVYTVRHAIWGRQSDNENARSDATRDEASGDE